MRLWPKSLVGRNALLIVALLVLAQVASSVLVRKLIVEPRVDQIAAAVAGNVVAMRAGLATLPAEQRALFVATFAHSAAPADAAGAAIDGSRPRALVGVEKLFVVAVSDRLARLGIDAIWRRDPSQRLEVRLAVGGTDYWLPMAGVLPARELTGAWFAASLATALLALLGALAIQRHLDRPLHALVGAAHELARGGRPAPLREDGPTEIATVSRSFNQLVAGLDAIERERALMLAGISHDLRTPLAKLRLGVELALDRIDAELAASLTRSIAEIDAIIDQFLDFARAAHGDDEALAPVALETIARDLRAAYADHGTPLQLEAGPQAPVPMRAALIRRAVANLIENALRHGRPPVVLRTGSDARSAWIEVVDGGDGIEASQRAALTQPFRRAGTARSGSAGAGLGLAIVERAAQLHGGTLALETALPHGLRARLTLPNDRR